MMKLIAAFVGAWIIGYFIFWYGGSAFIYLCAAVVLVFLLLNMGARYR